MKEEEVESRAHENEGCHMVHTCKIVSALILQCHRTTSLVKEDYANFLQLCSKVYRTE